MADSKIKDAAEKVEAVVEKAIEKVKGLVEVELAELEGNAAKGVHTIFTAHGAVNFVDGKATTTKEASAELADLGLVK